MLILTCSCCKLKSFLTGPSIFSISRESCSLRDVNFESGLDCYRLCFISSVHTFSLENFMPSKITSLFRSPRQDQKYVIVTLYSFDTLTKLCCSWEARLLYDSKNKANVYSHSMCYLMPPLYPRIFIEEEREKNGSEEWSTQVWWVKSHISQIRRMQTCGNITLQRRLLNSFLFCDPICIPQFHESPDI